MTINLEFDYIIYKHSYSCLKLGITNARSQISADFGGPKITKLEVSILSLSFLIFSSETIGREMRELEIF